MSAPEADPGPSGSGTVVLDLRPDSGALVLHTPAELDGQEIDLTPAGVARSHHLHSRVRPRHTSRGTQYAAVYPSVAPGDYTVWDPADGTSAMTVTITGASVTTSRMPGC